MTVSDIPREGAVMRRAKEIYAAAPAYAPFSGKPLSFEAANMLGTRSAALAVKKADVEVTRDGATSAYSKKAPHLVENEAIQSARDETPCTCGHKNLSHAHGRDAGDSSWPDGSHVGMGPCGYDRDGRNALTGWLGDVCPCIRFQDAER